jgi:hypothetical protein
VGAATTADRLDWDESLRRVVAFVHEHGRLPVKTADADEHERRLANWRHHNASLLNRGLLGPERARAFSQAGIIDDPNERAWNTLFERTVRFVEMQGRLSKQRATIPRR